MNNKTCINCIHKDVCYMYRLNMIGAREGYCTHYYEEPKKGEWIEEPGKIPHCSICGTYSDDADREDGGFYCTHCGAIMREVDNDKN